MAGAWHGALFLLGILTSTEVLLLHYPRLPGKGACTTPVQRKMAEDGAHESIDVELATEEEARASGGVPGGESSGWRESEQFWADFAATAKANGWGGWEMAMAHIRAPTAHGRGQSVDKEELQPRMVAVTGHTYSLPQGEQPETKGKVKRARGSGTSKAKKTKKAQEENRLGVSIDHKLGTSLVRVPVPLRPIGDEQEPSNKGSTLTPEADDLEHVRRGADTFKGSGQGKDRKRVTPEENIMNWLDAFALLAAIFLERYPEQGPALIRYNQAIQERFRRFGGMGWLQHDLAFRQRMEVTPGMSWDQREAEE
ncbi:hypothetical protein NDU88_005000 [Pleurodeles waltl]|uniref:Uncharacterized protein n=1 Tax=Pleurodeles waltl TaxID=8319 RepID=A0AAV7RMU6_PLEWA|nr:hypothetical protein NDU88_005000 [Pleurodeles waltl]